MSNVSSNFSYNSLAENVDLAKGVTFGATGLFGLFLNIIVLPALPKCDLNFATLCLMTTQCAINIVGLIPLTFVEPIVLSLGRPVFSETSSTLLSQAPGALFLFSVYAGIPLQSLMAINRLIAIGRSKLFDKMFTRRNSIAMCAFCMACGLVVAFVVMLPCCAVEFLLSDSNWVFTGSAAEVQIRMNAVFGGMTLVVLPACYTGTLLKLKKFRQAIADESIAQVEAKRELRVLLQFAIISVIWVINVVLSVALQQRTIPQTSFVTIVKGFSRYLFLVVDPMIYLLFMKKLPGHIRAILCRKQATGPNASSSVAVRRFNNTRSQTNR